MFKRILVLFICTFSIFSFAVESDTKLKQTTREDVMETYFISIVERNPDLMWKILAPEFRERAVNIYGSEAQGKKIFFEEFLKRWNTRNDAILKDLLSKPEIKKTVLKEAVEKQPYLFKQLGNLYYLYPVKPQSAEKK